MKNNRTKGFTLTELMVVILIIGILASVAIPEYMSAVDKSRWGALVTPTRSIKEAQEAKYMSTGRYASNMRALSVDIAGEKQENAIKVDKRTFTLDSSNEEGTSQFTVVAEDASLPNVRLVMYQTFSPNFADDLHCEALMDNARANRLCQDVLDGTLIGKRAQYYSYLIEGNGSGKLMNWPQAMESCVAKAGTPGCYAVQNEDGSWEEHYKTDAGIGVVRYYDADGHRYKQIQDGYDDGRVVTFTYDSNGNMDYQEATYPDGSKKEWTFDSNGNKTSFDYYYPNGDLHQHNNYDSNGNSTDYTVLTQGGTVEAFGVYNADGSVKEEQYYASGNLQGIGITAPNVNGFVSYVDYREDGSVIHSNTFSEPGVVETRYYYDYATGTYTAKPAATSGDSSTWFTGSFTVGTNGDITRNDGVVIPGRDNYQNLCGAHPDQAQCK